MIEDADFLDQLAAVDDNSACAVQHARMIWRLAPPIGPLTAAIAHDIGDLGRNAVQFDGVTTGGTRWTGRIDAADRVMARGFDRLAAAGDLLDADVVYGDDLTRTGDGVRLRLKPAFDPVLLARRDYIGRAALIRRAALEPDELASLKGPGGLVQIMRQKHTLRVAHLPFPVLLAAGEPEPPPARAQAITAPQPKISIIIPNRNSPDLIRMVTEGLRTITDYPDLEIIIVDNGSDDPATLAHYQALEDDPNVTVLIQPEPFNFAAMVNRGAAAATGDALLLLNNDVEMQNGDWLGHMVACLAEPEVGIVGAKLLFPDGTIQHAGVTIGHGGVAGHVFKGAAADSDDALHRLTTPHGREAVTAAAMLIRRKIWDDLGGFDERAFPVAFNDVDFCLRAGAAGWYVAMAPDAVLIHHEGASRGGFSPTRFLRHQRERTMLRLRHRTIGHVDRFSSPWHDPASLTPRFRMLKRLPEARF
ncbi:MAG: glycosyltransferase family 2 protein [Pseudomonadota bacterium]